MQNIINGKKCDASDKSVFNVSNPFNSRKIDTAPNSTERDVKRAIAYAKSEFEMWRQVPVSTKVDLLNIFMTKLIENKDELARLLNKETGMTVKQSELEIEKVRVGFLNYLEQAKHVCGKCVQAGTEFGFEKTVQMTTREPYGVACGLISEFNPCEDFVNMVAPTILTGNVIVLFAPEENPLTVLMLTELMVSSGLPGGVVQCIAGEREKTANLMIINPDFDLIFCFENKEYVQLIKKLSSVRNVQSVLRYEGNDAMIILEDADIDLAIEETLASKMSYAGQNFGAPKRFIIEKSIQTQFEEQLAQAFSELVVGNPKDEETQVGVLCSKKASKRLVNQLKDILAEGGHVVCGGQIEEVQITPSIITNVPREAQVANDQIINAPVVVIIPCEDVNDAISIANQAQEPYSAGVFTQNITKAFQVVNGLNSGNVVVNGAPSTRSFEIGQTAEEGQLDMFNQVTKTKTTTLKNLF